MRRRLKIFLQRVSGTQELIDAERKRYEDLRVRVDEFLSLYSKLDYASAALSTARMNAHLPSEVKKVPSLAVEVDVLRVKLEQARKALAK